MESTLDCYLLRQCKTEVPLSQKWFSSHWIVKYLIHNNGICWMEYVSVQKLWFSKSERYYANYAVQFVKHVRLSRLVFCCGLAATDLHMFFKIISLSLRQLYGCPNPSLTTLKDMGKHTVNWWYNHDKTKRNRTLHIVIWLIICIMT